MDAVLPAHHCATCLWTTNRRCEECKFKKVVWRGEMIRVVYQCTRVDVKCPKGLPEPAGFEWETIEIAD